MWWNHCATTCSTGPLHNDIFCWCYKQHYTAFISENGKGSVGNWSISDTGFTTPKSCKKILSHPGNLLSSLLPSNIMSLNIYAHENNSRSAVTSDAHTYQRYVDSRLLTSPHDYISIRGIFHIGYAPLSLFVPRLWNLRAISLYRVSTDTVNMVKLIAPGIIWWSQYCKYM